MNRDREAFGVELGRDLRRLRQAGGISQAELAGLHPSTIGRIERGRSILSRRTLIEILAAWGSRRRIYCAGSTGHHPVRPRRRGDSAYTGRSADSRLSIVEGSGAGRVT